MPGVIFLRFGRKNYEIKRSTLSRILKQARLSVDRVLELVKKYNNADDRVERSPSRWEFRASGMKFDIVTQWMIAYAVRHIPLCRACSDTGEDGAND
jgi:hypothetical protein